MRWPIACAARPTASHTRPSRWPSSIDIGPCAQRSMDECRVLDDRQARIERDWNALVGPLAIEAESRTPAELRAWLRQREEVVQLLEKAEEIRQSLEPLEQTFTHKTSGDQPNL